MSRERRILIVEDNQKETIKIVNNMKFTLCKKFSVPKRLNAQMKNFLLNKNQELLHSVNRSQQ